MQSDRGNSSSIVDEELGQIPRLILDVEPKNRRTDQETLEQVHISSLIPAPNFRRFIDFVNAVVRVASRSYSLLLWY